MFKPSLYQATCYLPTPYPLFFTTKYEVDNILYFYQSGIYLRSTADEWESHDLSSVLGRAQRSTGLMGYIDLFSNAIKLAVYYKSNNYVLYFHAYM